MLSQTFFQFSCEDNFKNFLRFCHLLLRFLYAAGERFLMCQAIGYEHLFFIIVIVASHFVHRKILMELLCIHFQKFFMNKLWVFMAIF